MKRWRSTTRRNRHRAAESRQCTSRAQAAAHALAPSSRASMNHHGVSGAPDDDAHAYFGSVCACACNGGQGRSRGAHEAMAWQQRLAHPRVCILAHHSGAQHGSAGIGWLVAPLAAAASISQAQRRYIPGHFKSRCATITRHFGRTAASRRAYLVRLTDRDRRGQLRCHVAALRALRRSDFEGSRARRTQPQLRSIARVVYVTRGRC